MIPLWPIFLKSVKVELLSKSSTRRRGGESLAGWRLYPNSSEPEFAGFGMILIDLAKSSINFMAQDGFAMAAILSNLDYQKIYNASNNSTHELIFSILRYTGERIGAVLKLDVMNVYANPFKSVP